MWLSWLGIVLYTQKLLSQSGHIPRLWVLSPFGVCTRGNWKATEWCFSHNDTRGGHKNPELSSGGWAPCSAGFPQYVSVLGIHLYQCTSWHCFERLRSASVNFFWRLSALLISWWVIYKRTCPHPCWRLSSCWAKTTWPPCLTFTIRLISPRVTFCLFPQMKNVLKGQNFADVEEVK